VSDAHSHELPLRADNKKDDDKKDEGEGKSSRGDRGIDWDGAWQQIGRELRGTGTTNPRDYVDMPSQFRRYEPSRLSQTKTSSLQLLALMQPALLENHALIRQSSVTH
jgi:hypothetical protein